MRRARADRQEVGELKRMGEELTRLPRIRMSLETLRVQVKLADNAQHATGARDFYGLT